jgi:hypothetical protein
MTPPCAKLGSLSSDAERAKLAPESIKLRRFIELSSGFCNASQAYTLIIGSTLTERTPQTSSGQLHEWLDSMAVAAIWASSNFKTAAFLVQSGDFP